MGPDNNTDDNGTPLGGGANDVVGPPVSTVPQAASAATPLNTGGIPIEVFTKMADGAHPRLRDVMERAVSGQQVSPEEMREAFVEAGIELPTGVSTRVAPRRPAPPRPAPPPPPAGARPAPAAPPAQGTASTPRPVAARTAPVVGAPPQPEPPQQQPLVEALTEVGLRLWNAHHQMLPGSHLVLTFMEDGVRAAIMLPADPSDEDDEPFILSHVQGDPDQVGDACGTALELAEQARQRIQAEGYREGGR